MSQHPRRTNNAGCRRARRTTREHKARRLAAGAGARSTGARISPGDLAPRVPSLSAAPLSPLFDYYPSSCARCRCELATPPLPCSTAPVRRRRAAPRSWLPLPSPPRPGPSQTKTHTERGATRGTRSQSRAGTPATPAPRARPPNPAKAQPPPRSPATSSPGRRRTPRRLLIMIRTRPALSAVG
jgi:hypothetical protein